MFKQDLYLPNGDLFATEYERVVHGERGDYVEFNRNQIIPYLVNHFDSIEPDNIYYRWLNPIFKFLILEDSSSSYVPRTYRNATADVTLVFAIDNTTAGEVCTRNAVLSQGKIFLEVYSPNGCQSTVIKKVASLNKPSITVNIAGNGIFTFNKHDIPQDNVDNAIYNYLVVFLKWMKEIGVKVELIRSGGQTGADEAGIKAAIKLGIPALIVCPKGYKYRTVTENVANKERFFSRFDCEVDPDIKVYYQLKKVKYADYRVGFYYVSPNKFVNFKDFEKLF